MKFVLFKSGNQYYWTLYAANNRKIADGAEGYRNKADALAGISLVKGTNSSTPGLVFARYRKRLAR